MREALGCESIAERGLAERYLAGKLSEAEMSAFESHFLTCNRCQDELRLGVAIQAALPEVRRIGAAAEGHARVVTGRWTSRPALIGTAAAAIAAVLIGVLLVQPTDRESLPHREPIPEAGAVPRALSPSGEAQAVEEFRWAGVRGADLYRITLYDATGEVIWRADTQQIHIALADAVELQTGVLYLWQVDARVGWDRWASSELVRFSLSEP